jgi:hypothetical protein
MILSIAAPPCRHERLFFRIAAMAVLEQKMGILRFAQKSA